jgi:hypothetical protein
MAEWSSKLSSTSSGSSSVTTQCVFGLVQDMGAWDLCGYSHGNLPDDPLAGSLDVGVDGHDFRPFDEISERMGQKKLSVFREEL